MCRTGELGLDVVTFDRYIGGVETIGLRELNQNPSHAVARVRAGESIVVTDRGVPVMRMEPETEQAGTVQRMVRDGEVRAPAERGMPDVIPGLADGVASLAELVTADRDRERSR